MPETTDNTGKVSPFIAPDSPMLSDVLLMLDDHEDLSASRRRDLKSALRTIARLIGTPLEAIPANINWLHIRLRRVHPAAHNMSPKRFSNVKSDALKALAITGCSRARADWLRQPSLAWAALLDACPGQARPLEADAARAVLLRP
jgi:hypothetical protein